MNFKIVYSVKSDGGVMHALQNVLTFKFNAKIFNTPLQFIDIWTEKKWQQQPMIIFYICILSLAKAMKNIFIYLHIYKSYCADRVFSVHFGDIFLFWIKMC